MQATTKHGRLARKAPPILLLMLGLLIPMAAAAEEPRAEDWRYAPHLTLALAGDPSAKAPAPGAEGANLAPEPPAASSLDFDLLGAAPRPADAPDAEALRRRRTMLTWHQGLGFGLLGLTVATTVVGQLNYDDKFDGGPNTGRYRTSHAVLAYSTAGLFAATAVAALLAPSPVKAPYRLDRVMWHRIALGTAAAAMLAQVALGIQTASREGYVNQAQVARTHLALGYVTLAAVTAGFCVLVF